MNSDIFGVFAVLGVNAGSTPAEINAAFKTLAMQHHPDRGGDAATFAALSEARRVLVQPGARAQLVASLRLYGVPCRACSGAGRRALGKFGRGGVATCATCSGAGYVKK